jgi:hypothetical protein
MSISSNIRITFISKDNPYSTLVKLINAFATIHWTPENQKGNIVYLQLGDIDDYEWKEHQMDKCNMLNLFRQKLERNEHVGIELTKKPHFIGGDFLFYINNSLSIDLSVNRKMTDDGLTDINWYLREIYHVIKLAGFGIEGISFNEHC